MASAASVVSVVSAASTVSAGLRGDGIEQRHVSMQRGLGTHGCLELERVVDEAVPHARVHQLWLFEHVEHVGEPCEQ